MKRAFHSLFIGTRYLVLTRKVCGLLNPLPHIWHSKGLWSLCKTTCLLKWKKIISESFGYSSNIRPTTMGIQLTFNSLLRLKQLSHLSHLYGRSSECTTCMWFFGKKIKGIYSLLFHYFWSALEIRYVLSYWMNFWIVDHICRIGRDVDRCVYAHVSANEKNIKKCSNSSGSWIFSYIRSFHSKFWMLCHIHCNDMFVHLLDYPRDDYSNFRSRRFLICH